MSQTTRIEWTDATWNPVTGCTKISDGCKNCYAERMAKRLEAMDAASYRNGFKVTLHPELLNLPHEWVKPRKVFVCSMSDLFHEDVPSAFIAAVFDTIAKLPRHIFQVLTKRPHNAANLHLAWPINVWCGVTVERADYTYRIDTLAEIRAQTKFLSLEPLLGPIPNLNLHNIDWVIVGAETGPGARRMKGAWAADIRDQCVAARVPFFLKSRGLPSKDPANYLLDGMEWKQFPGHYNPLDSAAVPQNGHPLADSFHVQIGPGVINVAL